MKLRGALIFGVIAALIALAFFLPRIPQSEAYHNFADQRPLLGIPNCLNAAKTFNPSAKVRWVFRCLPYVAQSPKSRS